MRPLAVFFIFLLFLVNCLPFAYSGRGVPKKHLPPMHQAVFSAHLGGCDVTGRNWGNVGQGAKNGDFWPQAGN